MVITETNEKYPYGLGFFPLNQAVKAPEHEIKDESEQPFTCL